MSRPTGRVVSRIAGWPIRTVQYLRIIDSLNGEGRAPRQREIADLAGVTVSSVNHHLRSVLVPAGLVENETAGVRITTAGQEVLRDVGMAEVTEAALVMLGEAENRVRAAWTDWNHAATRQAHDLAHAMVSEALHAWVSVRDAVYDMGARVKAADDVVEIHRLWTTKPDQAVASHA